MRFPYHAIFLCLFITLFALPSLADPAQAPEQRLGCALVIPSAINLSQASAVPIEVKAIWALGRMFPDSVTLKTDLGHFAGTTEKEVVLKKEANNLFPEVKLCFDNITQAPMQPCHLSLVVEDKECATASIALRQAIAIKDMDGPHWIPLGEKEIPWTLSWTIYDQFGKPMPDVPGLVQYTLPGSPISAITGVSDQAGIFRVTLPPAQFEGKFTAQLITATCASEPCTIDTLPPNDYSLPNLVATFAVPKEVTYLTQEDIPVLITVSSRDGRPLPEAIDLYGCGQKIAVPLKQGIGKVFLPLRGNPFAESINLLAAIEGEIHGVQRTRCIGKTSIPVITYPTSMQLNVTPLAHRAKDDPIGTFTATIQDDKRPFAHLPMTILITIIGDGYQTFVLETDEKGTVTVPIPAGEVPQIYAIVPGQSDWVILEQDKKGRLIAWGRRNKPGTFDLEAVETITYDADGNPVVTKHSKAEE